MPPIYQPELPAKLIVKAALDGRRSKVLGSWNKLLVAGSRLVPSFANQFAAIAAWESQLTSREVSPNRPVNLNHPADENDDHGPHGSCDDKAGGFVDVTFLSSLPDTAQQVVTAAGRTAEERRRVLRRMVTSLPLTRRTSRLAAG